jgi:hypothetical protein
MSDGKMFKTLRWLLIPVACIAAWYVALVVGIVLLGVAESFCPSDQTVSGSCIAPWFPAVETGIFCFSTALSAVLVVTAAFFVAPAARVLVVWLTFGTGGVVALYMAAATSAWAMFASAMASGLVAVLLLTRSFPSRSHDRSARPPELDGPGAGIAA